MKIDYVTESILKVLAIVLIAIIAFNGLVKLATFVHFLSTYFPIRVNCWFCNNNVWVRLVLRNSWTCPNCDQYNGFTKDGDYNKPLITNCDTAIKTPKNIHRRSPKNGLCKMCNINQQLKVTQLANFIPINEYNFEEEIENYSQQLEKAYKLCTPCRKVLEKKIYKEKAMLLESKLLESRTPEKLSIKKLKHNKLTRWIKYFSLISAGILSLLNLIEIIMIIMKYENVGNFVLYTYKIVGGLVGRLVVITKTKMFVEFPYLASYEDIYNELYMNLARKLTNVTAFVCTNDVKYLNEITQQVFTIFGCVMQIIRHSYIGNAMKSTYVIDVLWYLFVCATMSTHNLTLDVIIFIKFLCAVLIFTIFIYVKYEAEIIMPHTNKSSPKHMKNLINNITNQLNCDDESDDDVSLCKFNVNCSDSSAEIVNSSKSATKFTARDDSIWNRSKMNSTFCANSNLVNCQDKLKSCIFSKPEFSKYQRRNDSDSDLDESINSLNIGSGPRNTRHNDNGIFAIRKFSATPNFVMPTMLPLSQPRPLISPSKLCHGTSWVAGGYWGSESNRPVFSVNGSRSSSQSSGFESQTSSLNQRIFSHPPSREDSICGDIDKASLNDHFQLNQHNTRSLISPVYPQMRCDSHVHLPQARHASQKSSKGFVTYNQQSFADRSFKTPGSQLIKLPQIDPSH